jgi:hypothetical protein
MIVLLRYSNRIGDEIGKAYIKPLLAQSVIDPAVLRPITSPGVVAAPPGAAIVLVEVPRHLEGM